MAKGKRKLLKTILISGLVLCAVAAGIYWYVATEKFSDTKSQREDFTVEALEFIREFRGNDSVANRKYKDQVIVVKGPVAELETPDSLTTNVKFIDTLSGDYAIFRFQDRHASEAKSLSKGDLVSLKGVCTGSVYSDLLEVYSIGFIRSAISESNN